ncbi:MAG: restriction endonuclease subunit S [Desulforhabdus sp.]|jgi:type I restriction enzyme S subunit|nr:restriction endonuclease subunit S [Desulforhabdus sp.]
MSFLTALVGDLTKIRTGKLDANAAASDGKYPFFTCAQEPLRIDRYAYDCDAILVAGNGDLNVKHYKGKFEAYQRTCIIEVRNHSKLDSRYLYYFMSKYVEKLRQLAIGVVIKYIKLGMLTDAEIPLPPLAEQKCIAAILDKADAIRRKRQQAIKLADDFLRATFLDMFGDSVTNPKGWQIRPLSEIVKKGRIVTYGIVQAGPPLPEGVPYIRTGDIQDGKINTSGLLKTSYEIASKYKRSEVNKGDIVMSIRATVGTVAPLPDELDGANLTQGTARITPGSSTNREFLLWALKTRGIQNWIEKQVKGATFREITLAKLRELPVIVPPLESQEKFQSIVFQTQKLDAEINKAYNSCNEFFNSLTQRAFRGDL